MRKLFWVIALAVAAPAAAEPLEPFTGKSFTVSLPKGWSHAEPQAGIVVAQKDASNKNSPALMILMQPNPGHATEDQLCDAIVSKLAPGSVSGQARESVPGGGKLLLVEANSGGIAVRLGALALAAGDNASLALLVAPRDEFDKLGGMMLAANVLGSLHLPQPPAPRGKLDLPAPPRLTPADLAGQWSDQSASLKSYINTSSGSYAGYHAVSTNTNRTVKPSGEYTQEFSGYSGGTYGGIYSHENLTGHIKIDGNVLTFVPDKNAMTMYVIAGWSDTPEQTILEVAGPFYENSGPSPDVLANPIGYPWKEYWVRVKKK
jgi:hypothetical protein